MGRMAQTEIYIIRLKPRVKKIMRSCKTCTINMQRPCTQIMAPLPPEICILSLPFQTTGIDCADPFETKASPLKVSHDQELFKCFRLLQHTFSALFRLILGSVSSCICLLRWESGAPPEGSYR